MNVTAWNVTASECAGVSWDVDVEIDALGLEGNVTMTTDREGNVVPCGEGPDMWVAPDLLASLRRLPVDSMRAALVAICNAAAVAVAGSGVDPSEPYRED